MHHTNRQASPTDPKQTKLNNQTNREENEVTVITTKSNVVACSTNGMAGADSKHSLSGGDCRSTSDQSPGNLIEAIDPFLYPDIMLIKVKDIKIQLKKYRETGVSMDLTNNKEGLQEQLCNVHLKELPKNDT